MFILFLNCTFQALIKLLPCKHVKTLTNLTQLNLDTVKPCLSKTFNTVKPDYERSCRQISGCLSLVILGHYCFTRPSLSIIFYNELSPVLHLFIQQLVRYLSRLPPVDFYIVLRIFQYLIVYSDSIRLRTYLAFSKVSGARLSRV